MTAQCRFPIDDLVTAHAFFATVIWFHWLFTVSTHLDVCVYLVIAQVNGQSIFTSLLQQSLVHSAGTHNL